MKLLILALIVIIPTIPLKTQADDVYITGLVYYQDFRYVHALDAEPLNGGVITLYKRTD
jgi:hypothetical protein